MQKTVKTLFILKRREDYSTDIENFNYTTVSTGMYNSASFVSDMLNNNGIESKVITVIDNNSIDREVTAFRPTHVFIEGYWVVPEKFDVLMPLHPDVKWVVRCHSEVPFLSQEGIAIDWTFGYLRRGVCVSGNSPRINRELRVLAATVANLDQHQLEEQLPLLSNYYPVTHDFEYDLPPIEGTIDVGCFGAIRPLKNHLVQAIAAVDYANQNNLTLRFHINSGRVEMNGNNGLKNLRALFANLDNHELIEHPWTSHEEFLDVISEMDICLQVSFTETFNIVTADAVEMGVPVVVSDEVIWVEEPRADPTSSVDIVDKMGQVLAHKHHLVRKNRKNLHTYSEASKERWMRYLSGSHDSIKHGLSLDWMFFSHWL